VGKSPRRKSQPIKATTVVHLWRHWCEVCGEPFEAVRKDARFCGGTCKLRAYRAARRSAERAGA